jgi:hypothetical protein
MPEADSANEATRSLIRELVVLTQLQSKNWIPAFAGMTDRKDGGEIAAPSGQQRTLERGLSPHQSSGYRCRNASASSQFSNNSVTSRGSNFRPLCSDTKERMRTRLHGSL